jgi:hypothetical protein
LYKIVKGLKEPQHTQAKAVLTPQIRTIFKQEQWPEIF